MLFHLRDAFRAGDVWLARSRRYGDIRKTLLSAPTVADADRSLPVAASPHEWLAERRFALDEGLRRLADAARAGAIAGGSIEDSVLRVERTEAAVPDGAADLGRRPLVVASASGRVRIVRHGKSLTFMSCTRGSGREVTIESGVRTKARRRAELPS